MVWKYHKIEDTTFEFHIEIFKQLYLNMAFFIVPAVFCGFNTSPELHPCEIIGFSLAIIAWVIEFYADEFKGSFIRDAKEKGLENIVCDVGLWSIVRHPNYFGEWNIWNGLVIASIPSMCPHFAGLKADEKAMVYNVLSLACFYVSYIMYDFLIYQTGAIPAEYFSV